MTPGTTDRRTHAEDLTITADHAALLATLDVPAGATAIVIFAHGSGSGRLSPRNRHVAGVLEEHGFATLLIDLLTADEEAVDLQNSRMRFDVGLLAERLVAAIDWVDRQPKLALPNVGLFGASTGAGAALVAAAMRSGQVHAVVSRGGRPDLAAEALPYVRAPTLLIVGGDDLSVIPLNEASRRRMTAPTELKIISGASHLFEEPGALEEVARFSTLWFEEHLGRSNGHRS
jgi:putative phosphoribosyl transferase